MDGRIEEAIFARSGEGMGILLKMSTIRLPLKPPGWNISPYRPVGNRPVLKTAAKRNAKQKSAPDPARLVKKCPSGGLLHFKDSQVPGSPSNARQTLLAKRPIMSGNIAACLIGVQVSQGQGREPHSFCINYLCDTIKRSLSTYEKEKLSKAAGKEILCGIQSENCIRKWLEQNAK